MEVSIDHERFFDRLEKLQTDWLSHKGTTWGGSDALCIPQGTSSDELNYTKTSAVHMYLFGYEFSDSLILISRNNFYFMASSKKCALIESDLVGKSSTFNVHVLRRTKDEAANREQFHTLAGVVRKGGGKILGSLYKLDYQGNFIPSWLDFIEQNQLDKFEITPCLGLFFSVKDDSEMDMCKRAAVLSNKVMKHGFVREMEKILDEDLKKSHQKVAREVESIIMDPAKIELKVSQDAVEACYEPIVQSGGVYDLKVNAQSDNKNLSGDVIICSLGARYKGYCGNISRTFMVDVPPKIESTYNTLLAVYDVCLGQMTPGNDLKNVMESAKTYLRKKKPELESHLPKNLGFSVGLEFRDNQMLLNEKNAHKFSAGMVFNLVLGFHNVPLSEEDKKDAVDNIKKLSVFSLLIADIVCVKDGPVEVYTKFPKEFSEVSYDISGNKEEEEEENADDDNGDENDADRVRRSARGREEKEANEQDASRRNSFQQDLMKKRIKEARDRMRKGSGTGGDGDDEEEVEATDLSVYRSEAEFPKDTTPNRLKVDLSKECVLVPINGRSIPFHISTIKSMTAPDPDLRINFFIQGVSTKDVSKNMQQLVMKYGDEFAFIKELTFRSVDGKNLPHVYQQFQELKRRVRQREQKEEQEKDLVVQTRLVKLQDQRIPRLQEVTMRPQLSGRKCVGTLEAHTNGLRFISSKSEQLDVMYGNVKHAIFQPCDRTTMVLIHFHLRDFILVGKKKQKDVQFYTEVIEASQNLEQSRRSSYDPDELDEEQREREMRRRLNLTFKEFCGKVERLAGHYEHNLQIDVPFKKSGFLGNWSKEMVLLQPTTNCLVNLTEWPSFVLTLSEVEHVHFERVTYATKAFDITFIFKNWDILPKTIAAVDMKFMDIIQDWLNLIEITYTKGPRSINWNDVMKVVREGKDFFYEDVDEEGEAKPPGWLFLSVEDDEDEDEDQNEDSSFGEELASDEDEEDSSDDSDSEASDFSEEEDDFDEEEEEELEEKGQSWEELENQAKQEDRQKRVMEERDPPPQQNKKMRRR